MQPVAETPVEDFETLFNGQPQDIERRLLALRPKAACHPDITLAPRIEARLALAQAMQGRHEEASHTLELAESLPGARQPAAELCLLLERGRLLHQQNRYRDAHALFIRAWDVARRHAAEDHALDGPAVDAAHMVAITATDPVARVHWNETALSLAQSSPDPKARAWISVLHNNLAQAYIANSQFTAAHATFTTCRQLAVAENNSIVERGARWGIARALRALGQTTEALAMQQQVLSEYNQLEETGALPLELIQMGRGLVHEELAQLSTTAGPEHAIRALQDLKSLIGKDHPEYHDRLNKLKHLAQDHP
ncbi:MAG: tetratricopeptide repeat protein [Planctomycetaceae bacterium]